MIAVLGATGRIGRHVVAGLAQASVPACALVRDPALRGTGTPPVPLPTRAADLRDAGRLRTALEGIERLFLLTPAGPDQDLLEATVLAAARAARVSAIVKISGGAPSLGPNGPTSTAVTHWRSEQRIEASGIHFDFLRPSFLMQNLLTMVAPVVTSSGVLAAPMGHATIAMVDARDVAACAVALLTSTTAGDDAHSVTGPASVTFDAIAAHLAVPYLALPAGLAGWAMRRQGEPPFEVDHALRMAHYFASGADSATTDTVTRLTGRPPRSVEAFLDEHAAVFTGRRLGPLARALSHLPTKGS